MAANKSKVSDRPKKEQKTTAISEQEFRLYWVGVGDCLAGLRELLTDSLKVSAKNDAGRAAFALIDSSMDRIYELDRSLGERLRAEVDAHPDGGEIRVPISEEDLKQYEECLMPVWGFAEAADTNDLGGPKNLFAASGLALSLVKKVSEEGLRVLRSRLQERASEKGQRLQR